MKTILLSLFTLSLIACQNGQWMGPSIGVSAGYQGVTVGVSVAGNNPATPVIVAPTPTPIPVPSPSAK